MRMKRMIFLATAILCVLPGPLLRPASATHGPDAVYMFVEVETKVHRAGVETSSANPKERRWYISNIVVEPDDVPSFSLVKKKIVPYFNLNVTDPAEKRGIMIDYSELDVRVNSDTSRSSYGSRDEAEEARNKAIEYRKNQSGNIYSFELVWDAAKGEETSKPKLIYRDKDAANYEPK